MDSPFIEILALVLAKTPSIPNLNPEDLLGLDVDGEPIDIPSSASLDDLVRIGRLQTLLLREARASEQPSYEDLGAQADLLQQPFHEAAAHALRVRDDGQSRVQALETLIVSAVRALAPAESDIFGVAYAVRSDGSIVRRKIPQRRSLD